MPEIKNIFTSGKMNKDLDERLVPKREYREATNIDIVTSEGSDIGSVQNIDGNTLRTVTGITSPTCVGYVVDNENDKVIWFISGATYAANDPSSGIDAIVEYNPVDKSIVPIIIDKYKGRQQSSTSPGPVLEFDDNNYITGINLLNGILYWTDNVNEPKKVNVDRMKQGSASQIFITATSVVATGGATNGKFSLTTNPHDGFGFNQMPISSGTSDVPTPSYFDVKVRKASNNSIVSPTVVHVYNSGAWDQMYFSTGGAGADLVTTNDTIIITLTEDKNIFQQHTYYQVKSVNKGLVAKTNITVARPYPLNALDMVLSNSRRTGRINLTCTTTSNTITSGNGYLSLDQNESYWTYKSENGVVKTKPPGTNPANHPENLLDYNDDDVHIDFISIPNSSYLPGDMIKLSHTHSPNGEDLTLEVRLLIRGYWNDPGLTHLTTWAYNADTNASGFTPPGASVNYNNDTFHCVIVSMSDNFLEVGAIPSGSITWDVSLEQDDGLYKDKFPRFAYRWKYVDNEYSAISPFTKIAFLPVNPTDKYDFNSTTGHNPTMQNDVRKITLSGFDKQDIDVKEVELIIKMSDSVNMYVVDSYPNDDTFQEYKYITKENIKYSIPENQLLRPYDNVPKKALAQEVVGNRIVYGNYTQQYNIEEDVKLRFTKQSTEIYPLIPHLSVKSLRDYQLGIAYLDDLGRQSPILTTGNANIKITQKDSNKVNLFEGQITSQHPNWASFYKYFIKDSFSNDFYNIALDRIYSAAEEENVWLSFASSDVNKVDIDDYLVLKKAHGSDTSISGKLNNNVVKYKVLAKESEAPEFVKTRKIFHGSVTGGDASGIRLTGTNDDNYTGGYPLENGSYVYINASLMVDSVLENISDQGIGNGRYMRLAKGDIKSNWYEVESVLAVLGSTNSDGICHQGGEGDHYRINLIEPFGADISFTGGAPGSPINFMVIEWYHEDQQNFKSEFEGRFFIKVLVDQLMRDHILSFNESKTAGTRITNSVPFNKIVSDTSHFNVADGTVLSGAETGITKTVLDFTPEPGGIYNPPGGDPPRGQVYAFDYGYSTQPYLGSQPSTIPSQGYGFGGTGGPANQLQIRVFGQWAKKMSGHTNSNWYPPSQDVFYPDTYKMYGALSTAAGTKFMLFGDASETVYEILNVKKEVVINTNDVISSPNHERGIRFTLELDQDVNATTKALVDGLDSHNIFDANSKTLDNELRFMTIEQVVDAKTYYTDTPAVFEIERSRDIDLNLYYETPKTIMIPKVGMKISSAHSNFPDTTISAIENNGFTLRTTANMTGVVAFRSIDIPTVITIEQTNNLLDHQGNSRNRKQNFLLESAIASGANTVNLRPIPLDWFNCIAMGNGVESNRIKDDFNAPFIDKGPRVSTVLDDPYEEENRKSGLIYSGIFNAKSGVNETNQFIQAEKITKNLNPSYGSIQKLFTRNTNLLTLCEDKVLKILANKDALYNADGNVNLISTNRVLGQSVPFTGEYGISKNPESFASYDYRVYFSDKNRGSILRLSNDGITNISQKGMTSYFKKNLTSANKILGSYDKDKDLYNITLKYPTVSKNTTLSFTEKTKGWTSFKSFIPETGFSLNNKYYTIFTGELWEHGSSEIKNNFYGTQYDSSIKFVFNDEPSTIKQFKTISYEGTESRLYSSVVGSETTLETDEFLSSYDGKGWYVSSIETNEQSGSIPSFVEKEGKWFSHIKGIESTSDNMDSYESSCQGLGIAGMLESQSQPISPAVAWSYTVPSCGGGKADIIIKIIDNTNSNNGWWWSTKWAFELVDLGANSQLSSPADTPSFENSTYYQHTDSQITKSVSGTNTILQYTFTQAGIVGNKYSIFAKEYYTGHTLAPNYSSFVINGPTVLNAYGYVHANETSDGASDGAIRIQPQNGTGQYVDGKISVNSNMSSPTTDTSLAGSAPNQYYEFTGLVSGTYYYNVTDNSNACGTTITTTKTLIVPENPPLVLTAVSDNAAVCHLNDPFSSVGSNLSKNGSLVTLTATGGDGTYYFKPDGGSWVTNGTNSNASVQNTVATPSSTTFWVKDTTAPITNEVSVVFDQTDHTTDILTTRVVTDASNQAGDNGSLALTVINATGAVTCVLQKGTGSSPNYFSSYTQIGSVTMSESNDVHTHTFSSLLGQVNNPLAQPPTTEIHYKYFITDANGCRDGALIGNGTNGSGTFSLSNTYTPGPVQFSKVFWRLYDTADITTVSANDIVGWSQGDYPDQASSNIWAVPSTSFTLWQDNPNNGAALWSNCWRFISSLNAGDTYNTDVQICKIYSEASQIVDAANFYVRTTGFNNINTDGEHTAPAISSPGAIEDTSNTDQTPNIVFANSQTLNGTVADENNYVTVTVPFNYLVPNYSQKILFHIYGASYILGGSI